MSFLKLESSQLGIILYDKPKTIFLPDEVSLRERKKKQMARVACLHCLNLGPTLRGCTGPKDPQIWGVYFDGKGGIIRGGRILGQGCPRVHTDLLMSVLIQRRFALNR